MRPSTLSALVVLSTSLACGGSSPGARIPPASLATTAAGSSESPSATPIARPSARDDGEETWGLRDTPAIAEQYRQAIDRVVGMTGDPALANAVARRGLSLVNVAWEDTGRFENSSVGPNISDLSLQVRGIDGDRSHQAVMPVIRLPNFTDRTGDVPADKFFVRVGNERSSGGLRTVPLSDVLKNVRAFASAPNSILGSADLSAPRDSHYLVSAQAVFLPIPKQGKAEFNPVLFNYQSSPGSPAVLTILVTREGTSISVIENRGEESTAAGWGQELYFNNHGQRTAFTAERKSDVEARIASQGGPRTESDRSALAKGADSLFLVQVPLMVARMRRPVVMAEAPMADMAPSAGAAPAAPKAATRSRGASDVEQAVLGHGRNEGPFNEGRHLRLVRDPRFPVRITVQFYKGTSNGVASEADLDAIARSIGSVYEHAQFVGSLVVPDGDPLRPTAWNQIPRQWFPW